MGVDLETFAQDYWDTAPLVSRAAETAADFTDLLGASDVDSLVARRGLRTPFFRMVRDAEPVSGITRRTVAGSHTITDLADGERVRREFHDGGTLVLQSLHRIWPPIVEFCRRLAAELGHPTQCNAYITPAGNAKGFAYHHDTHDVFVLQVLGRKRWQVHPPVVTLPTTRQPRSGPDLVPDAQQPLLDIELAAGDAMYLPRGYVHAAQTTDSESVHLTVGVMATTWYDVLRDALTLAADDIDFRHALPVAPLQALDADPELLAGHLQQAAAWLAALPLEQVRDRVEHRLAKAVVAEPIGMLEQAAAAGGAHPATRTRPRRDLRWRLDRNADRIVVGLPDRELDLPAFTEPAVRRLLTQPGSVGDLVAGELDAAGAVVLARRLLREGAVVVDASG